MKLKIEYIKITDLKPYKNNAKIHTPEQVQQIKSSIEQFGMNDPIAVWKDNEVIEGHGRLMACQELGMTTVPIIRLDGLTDQQRKAYGLVHNKLTMNTDFDYDFLELELSEIPEIDMKEFGFDSDFDSEIEIKDDDFLNGAEGRTSHLGHNVFENYERFQAETDSYYGIPKMDGTKTYSEKLLRFCDYKDVEDCSEWIAHFYYDDYKFIQAWRGPDKYVEKLKMFKAVISPDFSLYTDFPRALQILSCYRRNWCGAYWQSLGIDVIPDVVWGDKESFKYCFDGLPKNSVVAVSAVGVTTDDMWNDKKGDMFRAGYNEMLKRLKPTKIIYYGTLLEGLDGDIVRVPSFYEDKRKSIGNRKD